MYEPQPSIFNNPIAINTLVSIAITSFILAMKPTSTRNQPSTTTAKKSSQSSLVKFFFNYLLLPGLSCGIFAASIYVYSNFVIPGIITEQKEYDYQEWKDYGDWISLWGLFVVKQVVFPMMNAFVACLGIFLLIGADAQQGGPAAAVSTMGAICCCAVLPMILQGIHVLLRAEGSDFEDWGKDDDFCCYWSCVMVAPICLGWAVWGRLHASD